MAALALGALGVVYGDIGTSPLYALQTVFTVDNHAVHPDRASVYGVISLVFWAITVIVSVKMVLLIMRADNDGEGGIMALIALVQNVVLRRRMAKAALVALGIFGASLFYGDGMITPAISVLSAVEGLEVVSPDLHSVVVPITVAIIAVLFAIQRLGTGAVGRVFGPVMAVWFTVLAVAGLNGIVDHPGILRAVSPTYGAQFLFDHGGVAFVALGGVVLTVTGAEALYADMGHFGRSPIRSSWFAIVFPALILNYMGQGALILGTPEAVDNPFFLLVPHWSRVPMVVLATVATVIASQAVISGAFSVTRQAVQLGFLPRLTIRHTSGQVEGQVYVPSVNWGLFVAVVGLVVGFGSSTSLGAAYGIAVTGTLAIDTLLFFVVVRFLWGKPLWVVLGGAAALLVVDLTFFAANLTKVHHGGWFPLLVALIAFTMLTTWSRGRRLVQDRLSESNMPLEVFVKSVGTGVHRVRGTAVYLTSSDDGIPPALLHNLKHNQVMHETVLLATVEVLDIPYVAAKRRVKVRPLGCGLKRVVINYGFSEDPDIPQALAGAKSVLGELPPMTTSYFLSRQTVRAARNPGMSRWREALFAWMVRNSATAMEFFRLPANRVVELGSQVEI
jgi:KUP system potassium uptake protein